MGYVRELTSSLALHADYVRAVNKDMFLARNLNPALRVDTSRTGALTRPMPSVSWAERTYRKSG
jgi:hypothetical protein